ncbi:YlzJ-like family protein [Metabacillus litoralis]|uniref:YlzJ-like family protein n=1 Tax=Metabacillus litoralis TaxID=152268 RepID=UPI001CFE5A47|nr:YlzJ-like family protein [Metabacillus litoralis]
MIFYTMVPNELIFPTLDEEYKKQSVVEVNGVQLLVQETTNSQFEIVRILSSDPNHFLDSQICPGQKVTMSISTNQGNYGIMN